MRAWKSERGRKYLERRKQVKTVMWGIAEIELQMEEVNNSFKKLDKPTVKDYSERDDKIAALLEERDRLHNQVVGSSK